MSEFERDPTRDPEFADVWQAFGQLASTADQPLDEQLLTRAIRERIRQRVRQKLLRVGGALMACAASIVLMASLWMREPTVNEAPVANPAVTEQVAAIEPADAAGEQSADLVEVTVWDDELAVETAQLADEAETLLQRRDEPPDSFAILQSQVDAFEREVTNNAL